MEIENYCCYFHYTYWEIKTEIMSLIKQGKEQTEEFKSLLRQHRLNCEHLDAFKLWATLSGKCWTKDYGTNKVRGR